MWGPGAEPCGTGAQEQGAVGQLPKGSSILGLGFPRGRGAQHRLVRLHQG